VPDLPATDLPAACAAALLRGLLDDASLLGRRAVDAAAVTAHRSLREGVDTALLGPLQLRVSQLGALLDVLDAAPSSTPLDVRLVADTGLVEAAEARAVLLDDDRVELLGLEVALPADGPLGQTARLTLDSLDFALPAAIEVPRAVGWRDALDVLADDGAERAKLRTGGPTATAHPTETELADLLVEVVRRRLAFKLTAGLHHALRNTDPDTGFEQHGFVNVLAATAAALDGADATALATLLAERDGLPLLAVLAGADPAAVRRLFTSFGSCSISDPVADLRGLGMLDEEE
jgi:hypothetical protein